MKKAWKEALKRACIDDCRAHDMRHTFCTLAAQQGASNLELATAMGHRTLNMLQRYTHLIALNWQIGRRIHYCIDFGNAPLRKERDSGFLSKLP